MKKLIGVLGIVSLLALASCGNNTDNVQFDDYFFSVNSSNDITISIDGDEYSNNLISYTDYNFFPMTLYSGASIKEDTLKIYTKDLGEATYSEDGLFVYSFNIKNNSDKNSIHMNMQFDFIQDHFNEIARVLTYSNNECNLYLMKDEGNDYLNLITTPTYFNENKVFDIDIELNKNDTLKYSILIWIDKNDSDINRYSSDLFTTKAVLKLSIS